MTQEYTLHKLPEGFIVTSNDDMPKIGELFLAKNNKIYQVKQEIVIKGTGIKKLIGQQDQIDFSALSKEEQKEIGWFDVRKITDTIFPLLDEKKDSTSETQAENLDLLGHRRIYKAGFQRAQELLSDRVFTLEEMRKALLEVSLWGNVRSTRFEDVEKIIQSLSQKSWKVELEMESIPLSQNQGFNMKCVSSEFELQPKLTNGKIKITKLV